MTNSNYEGKKYQFILLSAIRDFFRSQHFIDVMTPPMVANPGMETHIHPFQVTSTYGNKTHPMYLHTSPEFCMKELLSLGFENIFNLSYCFRDEPKSPIHRSQFIMLEWYRTKAHYEAIMEDCERLIDYCYQQLKKAGAPMVASPPTFFERFTIQQLFERFLNIDILNFLKKDQIKSLLIEQFPDVPLPSNHENLLWDDYFFLLYLNKIEPHLKEFPYLIIYEFPAPLAALSQLKKSDPRVALRFEIYIQGVELANCFQELSVLEEQKKRFGIAAEEKQKIYGYQLPTPTVLYQALEKGLPDSSGIALGVERLLAALTTIKNPFYL